MSTKKILLIDDEEDFCFFIKQNLMLSKEFSLTYATDPNQGIALAKKDPPELILMDIVMPNKDGLKALEILKKNKRTMSIPIIMLTAVEDDNIQLKAYRLYSEDYIVKPVSIELLKAKIEEVLNRQKLPRAG